MECLKVLLDYGANANIMNYSEERYNEYKLLRPAHYPAYIILILYLFSNTAVDYATLNDHEECVQILRERGGVSISAIKVEAAIRIQSIYRGYRWSTLVINSVKSTH